MSPPTTSLSHRLQRIAQAINNASVRGDTVYLELAQDELARLCAEADKLEGELKKLTSSNIE